MIRFLNLTVTPDRLKCAFVFADRPSAHRHINKTVMVSIDQVRPSVVSLTCVAPSPSTHPCP